MSGKTFKERVEATHGMKAVETDRLVKRREQPVPKKGRRKPARTVKRLPHDVEMQERRERQLSRTANCVADLKAEQQTEYRKRWKASRA